MRGKKSRQSQGKWQTFSSLNANQNACLNNGTLSSGFPVKIIGNLAND